MRGRGGKREVEEAGAVVSMLVLVASTVLATFIVHLVEGRDTNAGDVALSAAMALIVWALFVAIGRWGDSGASKREAGDEESPR